MPLHDALSLTAATGFGLLRNRMNLPPLIGRTDAWPLMGIGAAAAAAHPATAGLAPALLTLPLAAAGSQQLAMKYLGRRLDFVDEVSREGFILPSDETFGTQWGMGGMRIGYTRDNNQPVDIENKFLMRHTAMVGQSGVGKTTVGEYLLWQQTVRGGGWIFIDAKIDADTRDRLAHMMRLAGREADFHVLNIDDPKNSNTYNPLLAGDPDEVASRLLNLLPSSENNPGADFYRQSAAYALTVLVGALKSAGYRYHFADLAILLQSDRALEELERMPMAEKERATLRIFLNQFKKKGNKGEVALDVNRVKEILGGMSGRIALFAQGKFGQVMNTYAPEIDLTDIVVNNKCLYAMLPTMGKDQSALNLGKMLMSDLRTAVYNVQGLKSVLRPNPPFLVFADEMGSYVMPGISRLFEQARSASIKLLPAFQSFANLASVSPEFADIIIQNTWNKIFFKFAAKDSSEQAAEIIGKVFKMTKTISRGENLGESAQSLRTAPTNTDSEGETLGESWRETEMFRVTPDQLRALGMGECIVISGARMYHLLTPMLDYSAAGVLPEFRVTRFPQRMPQGVRVLNLEERYGDFLMEVVDQALPRTQREDRAFANREQLSMGEVPPGTPMPETRL